MSTINNYILDLLNDDMVSHGLLAQCVDQDKSVGRDGRKLEWREVIEELPESVKTREPWFAYDAFGDSNINFWVWLYATDRIASIRIKSELIKRLHARFAKEGITINYPVRLLAYEDSKGTRPPLQSDAPSFEDPAENH